MNKCELINNWADEISVLPVRKEPAGVEVILHNDDFTPMNFVLMILENIFLMDKERAKDVMLKAHAEGKAIIGWFTKDVAETKINDAMSLAREEEHPLKCSMEVAT
jgi:ATP-dependent Clp protease adaptor protein ClpS